MSLVFALNIQKFQTISQINFTSCCWVFTVTCRPLPVLLLPYLAPALLQRHETLTVCPKSLHPQRRIPLQRLAQRDRHPLSLRPVQRCGHSLTPAYSQQPYSLAILSSKA